MSQAKVSVIIPIWKPNINHLKICLDSVISQTHSDLEILISYRSAINFDEPFYSLIEKYGDHRIKVIQCKTRGIPGALNEAIMNAKGEFIARLDGDDFCAPDRFEKQIKFKTTHKCDVVGSWGIYVSQEGEKIGTIEFPVSHRELRKKMMLHVPIVSSACFIDRKVFEKIGLFDPSFVTSEDYEFWFRAMYRGYKFGNVPEYLVNIRGNTESVTRGKNWRNSRIFTIKAKNKAFSEYGFSKPRDLLYHMLTPFIIFISPTFTVRVLRMIGWYKT